MEFEKSATITAPVERVWQMLLDPEVMGACVPGMQSIEVVSDTQYAVSMQVKISFITARFKVNTTIVD
jgi:carbon monoxide dehydrogenase subunit G